MDTYRCSVCDHRHEEQAGAPDGGIAPGTRWADMPANWTCPECGAAKGDFEKIDA